MFREEHPGTDVLSNFSVQLLVIMSTLGKKKKKIKMENIVHYCKTLREQIWYATKTQDISI